MEELTGIHVKSTESGISFEKVEVDKQKFISECYRLLNCDFVTLIDRVLYGKKVQMWLDDEGKLKENTLTAIGTCEGRIVEDLVGDILIFKPTRGGNTGSFSSEEIDYFINNFKKSKNTSCFVYTL